MAETMLLPAGTEVTVRLTAEVKVENPNLTMDQAQGQLIGLGNKIISRDDEARTFVVAQVQRTETLAKDTEVPDELLLEEAGETSILQDPPTPEEE